MEINFADPGALIVSLRRIENGSLLGANNTFSLPKLNTGKDKKYGSISLSSSLDTGKLLRQKKAGENYLRRRNQNFRRVVPDELSDADNDTDLDLFRGGIQKESDFDQHTNVDGPLPTNSSFYKKKRPRPPHLDDSISQQRTSKTKYIEEPLKPDPVAESLAAMQASKDQLDLSLKERHARIKEQLNSTSKQIERSLRIATKLLPQESLDLVSTSKYERHGIGLNTVFSALEVWMRHRLEKSFQKWYRFVSARAALERRAATLMVSIVRGFLAKRRLKHLKLMRKRRNSLLMAYGARVHHRRASREIRSGETTPSRVGTASSSRAGAGVGVGDLDDSAAATYEEAIDAMTKLDRSATTMQKMARGFIARRKFVPQIKRAKAIRQIRHFAVKFKSVFRAQRRFYSAGQQYHAACQIQRIFRGRLARKRVGVLRVLKNRRKRQERFITPEAIMQFYFEQNGAAIRIQFWLRRLPWFIKEMFRRKYARVLYARWAARYPEKENPFIPYIIMKGGELPSAVIEREREEAAARLRAEEEARYNREVAAAVFIAKLIRGFVARRRVRKLRVVHNKEVLAAIRIQALARRFIACHRLGDAGGARYRSLLIKRKNWPPEKSLSHLAPPKNRKEGILFPHLKIGDKKHIAKMEKAAKRIQRRVRMFLAKRLLQRLKQKKRVKMVLRIQHWFITWRRRHEVRRALRVIQPVWRTIMTRYFLHVEAATYIQKIWRGHIAVVRYHRKRNLRSWALHKMQSMAIRSLYERRGKEKLRQRRLVDEVRRAGKSEYEKTELYTHIEFLWNSARVTKKADTLTLELQRLFSNNSTQGFMDVNKFVKFCKEAPGLLDKNLTAKVVELQFAKVKSQTDKRIDYPRFVELLSNIAALKFLDGDPSLIGNYTETMDPSAPTFAFSDLPPPAGALAEMGFGNPRNKRSLAVATTSELPAEGEPEGMASRGSQKPPQSATAIAQQAQNEKISAFIYGRLYGRPALLTKLIITILRVHPDYKKVLYQLHAKSALGMAQAYLENKYTRMQKWLRQKMGMKRMARVHERKLREKEQKRLDDAATEIQRIARGFLGKRHALRTAQLLYSKFIDVESGAEYWYNPRTKKSSWVKPRVLRHLDCGLPIRMPPSDEQFIVLCSLCNNVTARCYCYNCDAPMCNDCFESNHRGGKRRAHIKSQLDTCVQCDFQAGTRYCLQCDDCYCDTCYGFIHSRGRLRVHIFQRTCDSCEDCVNRSAQWRHIEGIVPQGVYCTVCYKYRYGDPDPDGGSAKRLKFRGLAAMRMQQKQQEEEKRAAIQASYEERQAHQLERKRAAAALTIQRVYRGFSNRRKMSRFIRDRREFYKLREKQRVYRENAVYKLLQFFGIAPKLESDTPLERVLKMYPSYMHVVLAECVEYQWSLACELWRAQEDHLKQQKLGLKPKGLAKEILAKLALRHAKRKLHAAEADLFHANTEHAAAEAELEEAEADEKKSGQAKLNRLRKALEVTRDAEMQAKIKVQLMTEEVHLATEQVIIYTGPLGLPKLVTDRRKNGKLLPFKVDVYRGRTLALSRWPATSPYNAADREDGTVSLEGSSGQRRSSTIRHRNRRRSSGERRDSWAMDMEGSLSTALAAGDNEDDTYDSDGDDDTGKPHPGKWKKYLRQGDVVIVNGVKFRIVAKAIPTVEKLDEAIEALWQHEALKPPEKSMMAQLTMAVAEAQMSMFGPLSAPLEQNKGTDEDNSKPKPNKSRPNTGQDGSRPQTGDNKRPGTAQSKGTSGGDKEEEDEQGMLAQAWSYVSGFFLGGDDDEDRITKFTEVVPTDDHLTLDKPWVLPDAKGLEVHKVIPDVFYMRPMKEMSRHLLNTFPAQKSVAIVAISLHKMAQSVLSLASMLFDDDSDAAASMRAFAASLEDRRDDWLKFSNTVVQMSWDNSIRRIITFSTRTLFSGSRVAAAALVKGAKMIRGKKETPYQKWQKSKNKVKVCLIYITVSSEEQQLGTFFIDTQAPADVLRMYVQRRFRDKLNNELNIGDSFVFLTPLAKDKQEPLSRMKEPQTFAHKLCVYDVDVRTMEGANYLKIIKEKRALKRLISEFPAEEMVEDGDGNAALIAPGMGREEDDASSVASKNKANKGNDGDTSDQGSLGNNDPLYGGDVIMQGGEAFYYQSSSQPY